MSGFDELTGSLGLRCEVIEVAAIPFEPSPEPRDTPRHYLVTLTRPGADVGPLRVVYGLRTFGMSEEAPRLQDVLFYLAVHAHQVERSESDRARWLQIVGVDVDDAAAVSLFSQQTAFCRHLQQLLGEPGYDALLRSYRTEHQLGL